jgi:hypothetical protein
MRGGMDELNAAAVEYLMVGGYVTLGYFWSRAAIVAEEAIESGKGDAEFYQAKIEMANFYYERIMPRVESMIESIGNGSESLMSMDVERFVFLDD